MVFWGWLWVRVATNYGLCTYSLATCLTSSNNQVIGHKGFGSFDGAVTLETGGVECLSSGTAKFMCLLNPILPSNLGLCGVMVARIVVDYLNDPDTIAVRFRAQPNIFCVFFTLLQYATSRLVG